MLIQSRSRFLLMACRLFMGEHQPEILVALWLPTELSEEAFFRQLEGPEIHRTCCPGISRRRKSFSFLRREKLVDFLE